MVRVTFSLDEETVTRLRRTAARLSRPQSQVVREAVRDYAERVGRLSEAERLRLVRVLDEVVAQAPTRSARAVDAELKALRAARRAGGRRGQPRS
jgi:predicted transcriptional regulator